MLEGKMEARQVPIAVEPPFFAAAWPSINVLVQLTLPAAYPDGAHGLAARAQVVV